MDPPLFITRGVDAAAVMLPDQFVGAVQFPLTTELQDPSAARKLGAKARDIGTQNARAILRSFQF